MHINNWRDRLDMGPDAEVIVKALTSGRPLLFVTGHFGNWEVAGVAMGLLGFHAHAVARELDNPYLEKFLRNFRERTGQRLLSKKGDFDQMQALMAKGGILATLGDQDAGQRGLFVDFFGRPASTHKVMALLAIEYQVPILVVGTPKVAEPMRYRIEVGDYILPEEYADRGDAVKAITQRLTTALEGIIRRYPEQYFWLHRRWKHQPKAKKGTKAVA
jgi:Kdo2-lipid IVA lauroyltransferase/acyltransferase